MSSQSGGKITIRTVAERTGCSIGTVSSVLTNQHVRRGIAMGTAQRIREIAQELGYMPNMAARRLRTNSSRQQQVVIAVMTSFDAPLHLASHAVHSLQRLLEQNERGDISYTVAIEMFHAGRLRELPGLLSTDRFHGAIFTNTAPADDDFLRTTYVPFPVVLVNRAIDGYSWVREDPEAAAAAADILIGANRRNVAVLHPEHLTQSTRSRVDAFSRAAMKALGRPAEVIVSRDLSEGAACDAIERSLAADSSLNGLYCVSDSLALGAYHALKARGRTIPRRIAVVGVGDSEASGFYDPPLTCVGVPHARLHDEAVVLLMQQVAGRRVATVQKCLHPVVVHRRSTGAAASSPIPAASPPF